MGIEMILPAIGHASCGGHVTLLFTVEDSLQKRTCKAAGVLGYVSIPAAMLRLKGQLGIGGSISVSKGTKGMLAWSEKLSKSLQTTCR